MRYLLARLNAWDVAGEGKISLSELFHALELARIYKVGQGMAGMARASNASPGRSVRPGILVWWLMRQTRKSRRDCATACAPTAFSRRNPRPPDPTCGS